MYGSLLYGVDGCNVSSGMLRYSEYSRGQLVVSNLCSEHTATMSALSKDWRCHEKYKVSCSLVFSSAVDAILTVHAAFNNSALLCLNVCFFISAATFFLNHLHQSYE